jgi:hypothetical protein
LARAIVHVAAAILPPALRSWGQAMEAEVCGIPSDGKAIRFAIGCLTFALREAIGSRIGRPLAMVTDALANGGHGSMAMRDSLLGRPRRVTAICAVAATCLGLAYMAQAGAPIRYLVFNIGALAIGLASAGLLTSIGRSDRMTTGRVTLALGAVLMLTSLFGTSVDSAMRWIAVVGIYIQPSLVILPVMAVCFARARDRLSTIAMVVAAVALATQPDRAMSGALLAGMIALASVKPERFVVLALVAAAGGFMATLLQPDDLPAMPFVDQILYSSFDVHPLAGMAVLAGSALMVVPAVVGYATDRRHRDVYVVFGAVWLAIIVAAALGNYPTPVVGYGGSAIIGYVVSLVGLPKRTGAAVRNLAREISAVDETETGHGFSASASCAT